MPQFCVYCGHPMAQPSPYNPQFYISLRNADNLPLTLCTHTKGLLKSCRTCGRLTRLSEQICPTPDCPGPLVEPAEPFPTENGDLRGGHTMPWAGRFPNRFEVRKSQDIDRLEHLVYRYGLLIGVSRTGVSLFRRQGDGWERCADRALGGSVTDASVIIDDGLILIAGQSATYTVSLSGENELSLGDSIPEDCRYQAKYGPLWIRFLKWQKGHTRVITHNIEQDTRNEFTLPIDCDSINSISFEGQCVLATDDNLFLFDPITGQHSAIQAPPRYRWVRAVISSGRIAALGFKDAKLLLYVVTAGNEVIGKRELDEDYLAELAWVPAPAGGDGLGTLYITTRTGFAIVPIDKITATIRTISLQANLETLPRCLALANRVDERRIFLRRRGGKIDRLLLLNPDTGAAAEIGAFEIDPLVCIADDKIVVAAVEGNSMKLRTFSGTEAL